MCQSKLSQPKSSKKSKVTKIKETGKHGVNVQAILNENAARRYKRETYYIRSWLTLSSEVVWTEQ